MSFAVTYTSSFLLVLLFGHSLAYSSAVIDHSTSSADEFKSKIADHDLILVKFYAPWCGHCKRLAPAYEEAANILSQDDPSIPLAKVDCTNEEGGKEICNENDVSGFPTLKIFTKGVPSEYEGGRDADSIVKKLRSLAGPASKEVKSFEKLDSIYKKGRGVNIIGVFKNDNDKLYNDFKDTASQNREIASYYHIFQDSASDDLKKLTSLAADKAFAVPSIVLARPAIYRSKFEPDYLINDSSESLKDWIAENSNGLVRPRDSANARDIRPPYVVVYYNVDYEKDPKGSNYWRNRVLKVASKHKGEFIFSISNINQMSSELPEFGLSLERFKTEQAPLVVAIDKDGKKFFMKEKFSVDTFNEFIDKFAAGTLEQFLKSEEEPEDNDLNDVKVAVGKNFDKLVTDSQKDVFIKFYAPWCGHCKTLAPTWDKLGAELKDEDGIEIVKLDATSNDIPDLFQVRGFPTIYWFPKDTKVPVKYEGGRSLEDLLGYVSKHATSELKGYDRTGSKKSDRSDL